jgi:hypothetical protein
MSDTKIDDVCPICIGPILLGELVLSCKHAFHATCVEKLVSYNNIVGKDTACPLCRAEVKNVEASNLTWRCDKCHMADVNTGSLVCVGFHCMKKNISEWDANSICYTCARITSPDVEPDYLCAACSEIVDLTSDTCSAFIDLSND